MLFKQLRRYAAALSVGMQIDRSSMGYQVLITTTIVCKLKLENLPSEMQGKLAACLQDGFDDAHRGFAIPIRIDGLRHNRIGLGIIQ